MISGFDYGTSNCAIGVIPTDTNTTKLLPLENGEVFLPSTVYAFAREFISEQVAKDIKNSHAQAEYMQQRAHSLERARTFRREESIDNTEQTVFFGKQAFDQYLSLPEEGFFIKSAKSFLGANGLRPEIISFYEDIVTVMMAEIKSKAELHIQDSLTHTVIGRPVNFQGLNAEKSNAQALSILETAAKRAGFKEVEFFYEPIAAGLDFETPLTEDKKVLVVDIGGGTTDCAMILMGPNHIQKPDRFSDFIGYSGERTGGNDFDIQIAAKLLMPLLGMKSTLKSGLPMPTQVYWDAVSTNNVGAQTKFHKIETQLLLKQLLRDTKEPNLVERFIKVRENNQNHQMVRNAEQAKIALSNHTQTDIDLDYIECGLQQTVSLDDISDAVQRPLKTMISLMHEAISQADTNPDLIYITGGSAKSPIIKKIIQQHFGDVEVVDGDHFGSVANGLTLWAQKIYQ
jgi:hypothetical chaperone protein